MSKKLVSAAIPADNRAQVADRSFLDAIGAVRRKLAGRYERWRHRAFDRRFGTDTECREGAGAEASELLNAYHGYHYEPIQLPVFRRIVRALPAAPVQLTFVDFGCGKGRALVLAAEQGFRRIVGIECDPGLYAAAQRNVRAYQEGGRRRVAIELHLGDAVRHELPAEDCLCFLYNPFDEIAMARMLARIRQALHATRGRLLVAYRNPRHGALMADASFLRNLARNRSFELYEGIRQ